jgi:DNA polymerase-3 subunit delta
MKTALGGLVGDLKAGLPEGHVLVITAPAIDRRGGLYRACTAAGEVYDFVPPEKSGPAMRHALQVASSAFESRGMRADPSVVQAFVDRVGTDGRQMANEAEKLSVYLGPNRHPTCADVDRLVPPSREIPAWDLADAFGRRDLARALEVLRQLLFQRQSAIGIIVGIQTRIRDLVLYREALQFGWLRPVSNGGRSAGLQWSGVPEDMARCFEQWGAKDPRRVHPYRASLLAEQARGFTADELRTCRHAALDAHRRLVSTGPEDRFVLEGFLIQSLARRRP